MTDTHILILLATAITLGEPIYTHFRSKMKAESHTHTSKSKVFKLITINLLINLIITTMLFSLLLTIIRPTFHLPATFYLFLITIIIIFYFNGVYITTITLENLKLLNPVNPIIKYVHEPISHVPIYSGGIIALFFIALTSLNHQTLNNSHLLTPILLGSISGIAYAHGQIYNGTYKYQLITSASTLLLFYFTAFIHQAFPLYSPTTAFFIAFCSTLITILLAHLLRHISNSPVTTTTNNP